MKGRDKVAKRLVEPNKWDRLLEQILDSIFLKGCISYRLLFHRRKKKRKKKNGSVEKALSDGPLCATSGIEAQIFVQPTITATFVILTVPRNKFQFSYHRNQANLKLNFKLG